MAAPTPVPAGFTPLGQITKQMVGKNINIIGVVTDILEPRPSKGEGSHLHARPSVPQS